MSFQSGRDGRPLFPLFPTASWVPILSQKLALVFQLLRKGGIRFTIPHALRFTTQVSGHDFSVLLEPSEATRKQRSRAVKRRKIFPCAVGPRAAAPSRPGFGLLGRNAAEREQKNPSDGSCFTSSNQQGRYVDLDLCAQCPLGFPHRVSDLSTNRVCSTRAQTPKHMQRTFVKSSAVHAFRARLIAPRCFKSCQPRDFRGVFCHCFSY